MNRNELKNTIHHLLSGLIGVTAIWTDGDGPKPKNPFVTLKILSVTGEGLDEKITDHGDGGVNLYGNRYGVLEVNYYGGDALGKMVYLEQDIQKDSFVNLCESGGISFYDTEGVKNMTELLNDTAHEERAMLEIRFSFRLNGRDDLGWFDNVEINGKPVK